MRRASTLRAAGRSPAPRPRWPVRDAAPSPPPARRGGPAPAAAPAARASTRRSHSSPPPASEPRPQRVRQRRGLASRRQAGALLGAVVGTAWPTGRSNASTGDAAGGPPSAPPPARARSRRTGRTAGRGRRARTAASATGASRSGAPSQLSHGCSSAGSSTSTRSGASASSSAGTAAARTGEWWRTPIRYGTAPGGERLDRRARIDVVDHRSMRRAQLPEPTPDPRAGLGAAFDGPVPVAEQPRLVLRVVLAHHPEQVAGQQRQHVLRAGRSRPPAGPSDVATATASAVLITVPGRSTAQPSPSARCAGPGTRSPAPPAPPRRPASGPPAARQRGGGLPFDQPPLELEVGDRLDHLEVEPALERGRHLGHAAVAQVGGGDEVEAGLGVDRALVAAQLGNAQTRAPTGSRPARPGPRAGSG